jgi:hypothetical protein
MATLNDFMQKLKSKTAIRIFKIEQLDANENVLNELTGKVISGDLSITDDIGSRKTANITFDNSDGALLPSDTGNIWMNKKFKISTGAVLDGGEEYYISRGIFLCSEPELSSSFDGESTISIQFLDKFNLLNSQLGGTLENTYIIPVGTSITSAVQQLLIDAGELKPPIIEPTTEVTPFTITMEYGNTYGDILIQLAQFLSWTCYFDNEGYFRFESNTDIETSGSVWDFSTDEITYIDSKHRYEFTKVFNNVLVIGDTYNGSTVRATATDTNSTSPTRVSLIGKKTKIIEDDLIHTIDLAQQRANAELQSAISLIETTDLSCVPIDLIRGGDIVTVTDSASGLNETRFLVKSLTFPLNVDSTMSIQCWKGRELI